jgi:hypothetical protein
LLYVFFRVAAFAAARHLRANALTSFVNSLSSFFVAGLLAVARIKM